MQIPRCYSRSITASYALFKRGKGLHENGKRKLKRKRKMKLEEAYEGSKLAKAVKAARLGHMFLQKQNAVLIHETDYTPQEKTKREQLEMIRKVTTAMESVFGAPLPREVNIFVEPNAGAKGYKCYCTSATYVAAFDELTAA